MSPKIMENRIVEESAIENSVNVRGTRHQSEESKKKWKMRSSKELIWFVIEFGTRKAEIVKKLNWILVPVLLVSLIIMNVMSFKSGSVQEKSEMFQGKALASYADYYPIRVKQDGSLYLDVPRFMRAVEYFSRQSPSRAAGELIYIGQNDSIALQLNDDERQAYSKLLKNAAYENYKSRKYDPLGTYKNIVDGIGQTFMGTGVEIVLHDTRNPLKSIVAIQNPITGRGLGNATTNFGYELIRSYAALEEDGPNYISYPLNTKDGKKIKSTTIPIYDHKNLIGFVCLNIDISKLDGGNKEAEIALVNAFTALSKNEKIDEVLEQTSRNVLNTEIAG